MHCRPIHTAAATSAASDPFHSHNGCCNKDACGGTSNGGGAMKGSMEPKRRRRRKSVSMSLPSSKFFPDDEVLLVIILVAVVVMIICCLILLLHQSREREMDVWTMISGALRIGRGMSTSGGGFPTGRRMRHNLDPLKPSSVYTIPDAMDQIGEKSDAYAHLRKEYDEAFPVDPERSCRAVAQARIYEFQTRLMDDPTSPVPPYDIHDCPKQPPENYPFQWKTLDIVTTGHLTIPTCRRIGRSTRASASSILKRTTRRQ